MSLAQPWSRFYTDRHSELWEEPSRSFHPDMILEGALLVLFSDEETEAQE